jgi:hypothetical protein
MSDFHTIQKIFNMDQGFRIGISNLGTPGGMGGCRRFFRGKRPGIRLDTLGDMPILTEGAKKITAQEPQGEDKSTGPVMVKRFFFNGVHRCGGDTTVKGDGPYPIPVNPNPAPA